MEMEMEMEMMQQQQQIVVLVSMGFSEELAAEALKATAGDILKATDWILRRTQSKSQSQSQSQSPSVAHPNPGNDSAATSAPTCNSTSTPPSSSLSSSPVDNSEAAGLLPPPPPPSSLSKNINFQPKIDHFFHFPPKTPLISDNQVKNISTINDKNTATADAAIGKIPQPQPPPPSQPLSERMRPQTLDQVVGQDHILGPNSALRSAIRCCRLASLLLWGPPGTGKTSIARAIVVDANSSSDSDAGGYRFVQLSAVNSGVKDVRDAVDDARSWEKSCSSKTLKTSKKRRLMRTVLFIDEVHRFNKAQQDSLLPVIEDGSVVFVGATTENPSFHLITPLLSRCTLLVLNPLRPHDIVTLLNGAVSDTDKGIQVGFAGKILVEDEAIQFLSTHCDGDARVALNALEISATVAAAAVTSSFHGERGSNNSVTLGHVKEALQCKHIAYDRAGDEHYNLISALHKSMRGSDPDASIYWLARMLEGGEQPLYIARRLIRFASEDVGLADPFALTQAVACYQACHFIGMPECNVNLAQCVCYLALAPKSVAVYKAIEDAQKIVRESVGQNEGVPLHLRNAPTKVMKDIGYGKGYIYPPDYDYNSLSQTYMPSSLQGYKFLCWPNAAAGSN